MIGDSGQASGVPLFLQNNVVILADQVWEAALVCLLIRIRRSHVVRFQGELRRFLRTTESVVALGLRIPLGIAQDIVLNVRREGEDGSRLCCRLVGGASTSRLRSQSISDRLKRQLAKRIASCLHHLLLVVF